MISVIVPTFNSAKTVSKAINSILNQTYKDVEIIVVDDASTDNTVEVVKNISQDIIVTQLETNQGAGAARNVGIDLASGEYIAFLDSDDWYEPEHLQYMYDNKGDFEIVCTERVNHNVEHQDGIRSRRKPYGNSTTFMVKRSFVIEHNCRQGDRRTGEDSDFRSALWRAGARRLDLPYRENTNYCVVQHLGSLSDFQCWEDNLEYKLFMNKMFGNYYDVEVKE